MATPKRLRATYVYVPRHYVYLVIPVLQLRVSVKSTCVRMEVSVLNTRGALLVTVLRDIGGFFAKREVSLAVFGN